MTNVLGWSWALWLVPGFGISLGDSEKKETIFFFFWRIEVFFAKAKNVSVCSADGLSLGFSEERLSLIA